MYIYKIYIKFLVFHHCLYSFSKFLWYFLWPKDLESKTYSKLNILGHVGMGVGRGTLALNIF